MMKTAKGLQSEDVVVKGLSHGLRVIRDPQLVSPSEGGEG